MMFAILRCHACRAHGSMPSRSETPCLTCMTSLFASWQPAMLLVLEQFALDFEKLYVIIEVSIAIRHSEFTTTAPSTWHIAAIMQFRISMYQQNVKGRIARVLVLLSGYDIPSMREKSYQPIFGSPCGRCSLLECVRKCIAIKQLQHPHQ